MTSVEKKIGIILVNYNDACDTLECINSLLNQNYHSYFIIVVDNNSRNDIEEIQLLDQVELIRLNRNIGFGPANNIGAERAIHQGADYILCLNNDTVVERDFLKKINSRASDDTIVTTSIFYYDNSACLWYGGGEISRIFGTFRHKNYFEERYITFATGCCMLIPASCINKIGLFSEEYFMYYEDGDFSIKAIQNGYKLLYIPNVVVLHKVGQSIKNNQGMQAYYLTRNRLYILEKYNNYFHFTSLIYFYITRLVSVVAGGILGKKYSLIQMGIYDCRHKIMGPKINA